MLGLGGLIWVYMVVKEVKEGEEEGEREEGGEEGVRLGRVVWVVLVLGFLVSEVSPLFPLHIPFPAIHPTASKCIPAAPSYPKIYEKNGGIGSDMLLMNDLLLLTWLTADDEQLGLLNEVFERTAYPTTAEREELARRLGMTSRSVQIWVCPSFSPLLRVSLNLTLATSQCCISFSIVLRTSVSAILFSLPSSPFHPHLSPNPDPLVSFPSAPSSRMSPPLT